MSKVAVITGAGRRRVGNVIACALSADGFDVVLHYHSSQADAESTVTELTQNGATACALQANVADEADVKQMFQQVVARFGRIDALVNTASIWRSIRLEEITADDVRRSFEVNALGSFLCCREAGLIMAQQPEGGSIVNFGDWAIERPYTDHAAYFTAKGSIPTMTRAMAVELAARNPKVRVNCIHPGPVMFPQHLDDSQKQALISSTLVKDANRPDAISQAVRFLIDNTFVTGVCLPIDGGRTIYAPGSDEHS